ncbi:MAG: DUF3043 domain-containing protein [Brachybacterium sp.]|nr:DUF3043 domain-containing protein [Brachybacterium sp.]
MSSRRATESDTTASAPETRPNRPGSKGRPTRSRKEAQAARKRPLVPTDRKEARRRSREEAAKQRARANHAMATGDVDNMPLQHRGKDRRYVRDVVDARRNVAEFFFPAALVFMVFSLVLPLLVPQSYAILSTLLLVVLWGGILASIVDSFLLRRQLRAGLLERFGTISGGLVPYGIMRSIQIRRLRLPKPELKHGDTVR